MAWRKGVEFTWNEEETNKEDFEEYCLDCDEIVTFKWDSETEIHHCSICGKTLLE